MTQEKDNPYQIAVVVTPYFNAMATCAFLDPFRAANYLSNKPLYHWIWYSSLGGPVKASNGMEVNSAALEEMGVQVPDMAVISSSWVPEDNYRDRRLMARLRSWKNSRVVLCGLDTGALILAHAGLLKGRLATVHYEHIDTLREVFPEVRCCEQLYVIDGNFLSTGGGLASSDLAGQLIRSHHGDTLANESARYIYQGRLRPGGVRQHSEDEPIFGTAIPARLNAAILLMEQNLDDPLPISEIARHVNVSKRHLARLFKTYTKYSVIQYYRNIRLDRGRTLVTQSDMSILEVAIACGFGTASYFSRAYHERFGISPREDRVAGRVPFEYRAWPMHPKG